MSFPAVLAALLIFAASTPAAAQGGEAGQGASPQQAPQQQAAPQQAAPSTPPMRIEVDQKTLQGEDAYVAVFETLTPEQKLEQEALDKQFFASMRPIMDIYELGGRLMYCLNNEKFPDNNNAAYVQSFKAFQKLKSDEQEEMWKKHRLDAGKVAYIQHPLMDSHYSYIQAVQKAAAEQMVVQTGKAGGYTGTDCAEVQKTLEIAHQKASESLKSGTLGTPAK